jgi:hypothetical protein
MFFDYMNFIFRGVVDVGANSTELVVELLDIELMALKYLNKEDMD